MPGVFAATPWLLVLLRAHCNQCYMYSTMRMGPEPGLPGHWAERLCNVALRGVPQDGHVQCSRGKHRVSEAFSKSSCITHCGKVCLKVIATPAPYTPPPQKKNGSLPRAGGIVIDIVKYMTRGVIQQEITGLRIHKVNLQYLKTKNNYNICRGEGGNVSEQGI
jgi:hypothetical protein